MENCPIFSLIRRISATGLGLAALLLPPSAVADLATDFPKISMISPELEAATGSRPVETLTVQEIPAAPKPPRTIDLTASPDNLWERIRNGFAMRNLNNDLVLSHEQWYLNRPDLLRRMVERSRPFLHYIVDELEARGMPTELALLPMVESSYNPMAYSRSHASGLWQFIPATGKRFNLEQDWWHDERRDIVASTDAALDYLQTIYEMHGDWHLALASYNWGEGAVKRAIERNEARGLPTDYADLNMPEETRHYIPKLQALKNIFGNPRLMAKLHLPEIINQPYFASVETEKPIDVKTAARLANISVDEFLALNPSHNRPVIKGDTSVIIPADKVETFQNNLESHDAPLTRWQAYTIKSGERLGKVASRFGISLAALCDANGLSKDARVSPGSTVLVPAGKGGHSLEAMQDEATPIKILKPVPRATRHQRSQHVHGSTRQTRTRQARSSPPRRTVVAHKTSSRRQIARAKSRSIKLAEADKHR